MQEIQIPVHILAYTSGKTARPYFPYQVREEQKLEHNALFGYVNEFCKSVRVVSNALEYRSSEQKVQEVSCIGAISGEKLQRADCGLYALPHHLYCISLGKKFATYETMGEMFRA